jgi:hypothetical protein
MCAEKRAIPAGFSAGEGRDQLGPSRSPLPLRFIGESLEIRVCVHAIGGRNWTWRMSAATRIRRIQQILSGRELAGSMNHCRKFAC